MLLLAWCFVKVLGSLRQRIQAALVGEKGVEGMVREAQRYLLEREDRLVNARRHALEAPASLPPSNTPPSDPFDRGKTWSCHWEFVDNKLLNMFLLLRCKFANSICNIDQTNSFLLFPHFSAGYLLISQLKTRVTKLRYTSLTYSTSTQLTTHLPNLQYGPNMCYLSRLPLYCFLTICQLSILSLNIILKYIKPIHKFLKSWCLSPLKLASTDNTK